MLPALVLPVTYQLSEVFTIIMLTLQTWKRKLEEAEGFPRSHRYDSRKSDSEACDKMDICVPYKILMLKPNPQCEGIWKWGLWEVIRS